MFTSVSIAIFITYRILEKYNNYGDSSCRLDDYSLNGIKFKRSNDNVTPEEKSYHFNVFGENPYEDRVHSIPEQLLKNSEKKDQEDW